ncbi:MAG: SDR family oxidoreductase, partial [Longimicrobiales bacterium]
MSATPARRYDAARGATAPALRVLVLGGRGQLGSDVVRAAAGFDTLAITPFTRAQLDLADITAIHRVLHDAEFDVVLNCAGCNRTMEAERDPREAFAINAHAVGAVAAVCRERSARLVHVSSDYVFDGTNDVPYTERDAVRPLNVYGASKALGEALAMHHQPEAVIVRAASLFG